MWVVVSSLAITLISIGVGTRGAREADAPPVFGVPP